MQTRLAIDVRSLLGIQVASPAAPAAPAARLEAVADDVVASDGCANCDVLRHENAKLRKKVELFEDRLSKARRVAKQSGRRHKAVLNKFEKQKKKEEARRENASKAATLYNCV